MNIDELKKLSTKELVAKYNELTGEQVARMASREVAERRTIEALKAKGEWVDEVVNGNTEREAKNIHETAKAGINTGSPERREKPRATRGRAKGNLAANNLHPSMGTPVNGKAAKKGAGKAQETTAKAQPEPKAGKGKGEGAGGAEKPTPAAGKRAGKRGRGAPQKNPTYTAIAPTDKAYNPKGFKPQATSDRMVVLEYIRSNNGQRTRDQIVAHFDGQSVNVNAALYYLGKYGFCRVSE